MKGMSTHLTEGASKSRNSRALASRNAGDTTLEVLAGGQESQIRLKTPKVSREPTSVHMRKNCWSLMSARLKRTWPFQNVSPVNENGPRRNLSSLSMQFLTRRTSRFFDPDEAPHRLCQHWGQHLRGAQQKYPERPGPDDSVLDAAGAPRCDLVCCFGYS